MVLDVPTLTVMVWVNALAMSMALTASSDFDRTPGSASWVWGSWMQVLGWACFMAGYRTNTFWLLTVGSVAFASSFSFAYYSVRAFTGGNRSFAMWLLAAPLLVGLLHPTAQWFGSVKGRVAVVSVATAVQAAMIVWLIVTHRRELAGKWIWLVAATMGTTACLAVVKLVDVTLFTDPTLQSNDLLNVISLVMASININLNSLGLLLAQRGLAQQKLKALAATDALTGLMNRRALMESGARQFAHAVRHHGTMTVVMLDLDHFKHINDRHGHLVGDEVLMKFAALLTDKVRSPDLVGRYGGEEFCIIMPSAAADVALTVDARLREALADVSFSSPGLQLDFSAGAAEYSPGDASFEAIVSRADDSLYAAKHAGRARMNVAATPVPPQALRIA